MAPPTAFGYKMAWLAVRTDDPEGVIRGLDIDEAGPCSWSEGIERVYAPDATAQRPAFVTPALDGWVLVVSPAYFDELSDAEPERLGSFVEDLAKRLGTEIQLFGTHRVVEGHAWARGRPSGLERAFFYLGEVGECLVDAGEPTPVELTTGSPGAAEAELPGEGDVPDEETVMAVAGAWSIDPTRLEEEHPDVGDGWLGRVSAREPKESEAAAPASHETEAVSGPAKPRPWWKFW